MGWRFALQANGFEFYNDWPSMKKWLQGQQIFDEYGDLWTIAGFADKVETKQKGNSQERYALEYPSGTFFQINGYDFMDCEFS